MENDAPPGWEKLESRSKPGKFYYFNETTGVTSWKRPIVPQAAAAAKKPRRPLPPTPSFIARAKEAKEAQLVERGQHRAQRAQRRQVGRGYPHRTELEQVAPMAEDGVLLVLAQHRERHRHSVSRKWRHGHTATVPLDLLRLAQLLAPKPHLEAYRCHRLVLSPQLLPQRLCLLPQPAAGAAEVHREARLENAAQMAEDDALLVLAQLRERNLGARARNEGGERVAQLTEDNARVVAEPREGERHPGARAECGGDRQTDTTMQFQRKPLATVHKNVVHNRCSPAALFTRVHGVVCTQPEIGKPLLFTTSVHKGRLFTKGVCSQDFRNQTATRGDNNINTSKTTTDTKTAAHAVAVCEGGGTARGFRSSVRGVA